MLESDPARGAKLGRMGSLKKRLRPRLLVVYALVLGLLWLARPTPQSMLLGSLPVMAGVGLRLWATGHLVKTDDLTMTGPYAYVRHPLYLGTLLIAFGFAWMAASAPAAWLLGAILLGYFGYYLPYKDRIEGARLESLYGDAFRRYAVAVPRLVPRLHAYVPLAADRGSPARWSGGRFSDNHELGSALGVGLGVLALVARWVAS